MADAITTAVTGAVAAASAPLATGRPPEDVLLFALLGSVVAVWLDGTTPERGKLLAWSWSTFMLVFVSVLSGVVGSALLQNLEGAPYIGALAKVQPWISACVIAALIHRLGPLAWRAAAARVRKDEGKPSDVTAP